MQNVIDKIKALATEYPGTTRFLIGFVLGVITGGALL